LQDISRHTIYIPPSCVMSFTKTRAQS